MTAWYLGLRLGVIVAAVDRGRVDRRVDRARHELGVYGLVLAWSAALYFFGPKISKASGKSRMFGSMGGSILYAREWAKRVMGRK